MDRPKGAGPVAAGVRITGVDLKSSAMRTLFTETIRKASSYRSAVIFSQSLSVSMRGDSAAAMRRDGKAVNSEILAAAPAAALPLMKSRRVYFMV